MADTKIGVKQQLSAKSLEHYNETGVVSTMKVFQNALDRFNQLTTTITNTYDSLEQAWEGEAYETFVDIFDRIFLKVRDIGKSLGTIYDTLNKVQLDFYSADETIKDDIRRAASGGSSGSGSSGSAGGRRPVDGKRPDAQYVPDLVFDPLPAKPVLVSTMGEAYKPDLSYAAMSPRPVLNSCMPSAVLLTLVYSSLAFRDQIESKLGSALEKILNMEALSPIANLVSTMDSPYQPVLDMEVLVPKPDLVSNMGSPVVADIDMEAMAEKPELVSTMGSPVTANISMEAMAEKPELFSTMGAPYIPDLSYVKMHLRGILEHSHMAAIAALSVLTEGHINGTPHAELISTLGEALITQSGIVCAPEELASLSQIIGEAVYNDLYGGMPGSTGGIAGAGISQITDSCAYADHVNNIVAGVLAENPPGQPNAPLIVMPNQFPVLFDTDSHCCFNPTNYNHTVLKPSSICQMVMPLSEMNVTAVPKVIEAVQTHAGQCAIEMTVVQQMQNMGNGRYNAILSVDPTSQSFSQSDLTISFQPGREFGRVVTGGLMDTGVSINKDFVVDCMNHVQSQGLVSQFEDYQMPLLV